MKNILMTTHNSIPDSRVEKEAISLRENGFSVFLITPKIEYKEAKENFDEVFIYKQTRKHNFFFKSAINGAAKFYSKIVEEKNIDAIHSHNIFTALIGSIVAKKHNIKFIYDDHETWYLYLKEKAKAGIGFRKLIRYYLTIKAKFIEKKLVKKADLIIVTNHKCIDYFEKLGFKRNKIISVENIALQSEIDLALKSKNLVDDFIKNDPRKKIINTYRLPEGKQAQQIQQDIYALRNFDRIIEAQEKLHDWVLVLVGKRNPELEKRGVKFIDYMPRINYLANVAQADVGLNPIAINEKTLVSSQNRVFEFAKLGVRIISTKTPLLSENFEDKLVWFNPDEPLDKLIEILKKIDQYPSGKELQKYSEKFSWEIEIKKIIEAYRNFN